MEAEGYTFSRRRPSVTNNASEGVVHQGRVGFSFALGDSRNHGAGEGPQGGEGIEKSWSVESSVVHGVHQGGLESSVVHGVHQGGVESSVVDSADHWSLDSGVVDHRSVDWQGVVDGRNDLLLHSLLDNWVVVHTIGRGISSSL